MNDKIDLNNNESPKEVSRAYARFYAFFLIPMMIVMFGFFIGYLVFWRSITHEPTTVIDLINTIESGGQSKKWQSALDLARKTDKIKALSKEDRLYFDKKLSSLYKRSKSDLDYCHMDTRNYLAATMGSLEDEIYANDLLLGLKDKGMECQTEEQAKNKFNSKIMAITSLGQLDYSNNDILAMRVTDELIRIIESSDVEISDEVENVINLHSIIAIGEIGHEQGKEILIQIIENENWSNIENSLYNGIIPINIKWNASVALGKMNVKNEMVINYFELLLSREYYHSYRDFIDEYEQDHSLLIILDIIKIYKHDRFRDELQLLNKDPNI